MQDQSAKASKDLHLLLGKFAALSLCRADFLFELNNEQTIVFGAGAVNLLKGCTQTNVRGKRYIDLIQEHDQEKITALLSNTNANARINDVETHFIMQNGTFAKAVMSGYRVPDFEDNFFLAIKIDPRPVQNLGKRSMDREAGSELLHPKAFASVAADRISTLPDAGAHAKISMIKINNIDEIKNQVSAAKQIELFNAVGKTLNENSLGGETAGRIDENNFSVLHSDSMSSHDLEAKLASNTAKIIGDDGVNLDTTSTSLSADMTNLTASQINNAIIHTMKKFSKSDQAFEDTNMAHMFSEKMAETNKAIIAFRRVCESKHFDLAFMPICNLSSGSVHHFEALTRFRGNAGGIESSPYELITLAEEVGIVSEFDLVVVEKSIALIKTLTGVSGAKPIAINVSGQSISQESFVEDLHLRLNAVAGLNEKLTLEITESSEITDLKRVNAHIQEFRANGFKVALDDFGAGAASFDYLNSFEIDTVKFDGPVIKRAYATKKGKAFLASMATLCKQTGIETIAEMVEDENLASFLNDCGVDFGQGYYYGRPDFDMNIFANVLP